MNNLNESFAIVLLCIASADGTVDEGEKNRISELYSIDENRMDTLNEELMDNKLDIVAALEQVSFSEEKVGFINNIISVCYSDGKYQKDEKEAVRNLCALLDISDDILAKAEKSAAITGAKQRITGMVGRFDSKEDIKSGFKKFAKGAKNSTKNLEHRIVDSSKSVSATVSNGLGSLNTRISFALASAKKTKQENEKLRAELKNNALSETVKQNVIMKLNAKITVLKSQLEEEKKRNDENEEIIALLQMQIDDLKQTCELAENTKTA